MSGSPPKWWTRSQSIRTLATLDFNFPIAEAAAPVYEAIAPEVTKLHRLGLSFRQIAKRLGIDDKTVAKACR